MNGGLYVPLSVSTYDDPRLVEAGPSAELLWYRLLQLAKRLQTDGVLAHAQVVRLSPDGTESVHALTAAGLLRVIADNRYELAGWLDWNPSAQSIEEKRKADRARKQRKRVPAPDVPDGFHADSARNPDGIQTDSARIPRVERREEKRREVTTELLPEPTSSARVQGRQSSKTEPRRDALFDALLVHAEGVPLDRYATVTDQHKRTIAVAKATIAKAGGTAEQVPGAVRAYRAQFTGASVTAAAIAKHWGRLVAPKVADSGFRTLPIDTPAANVDASGCHSAAPGLPGVGGYGDSGSNVRALRSPQNGAVA